MRFTAILATIAIAAAVRISKQKNEPTHTLDELHDDVRDHLPDSISAEEFAYVDTDGSGMVDKKEMKAILAHYDVYLSGKDNKKLLSFLSGGDGKISLEDANAALEMLKEM